MRRAELTDVATHQLKRWMREAESGDPTEVLTKADLAAAGLGEQARTALATLPRGAAVIALQGLLAERAKEARPRPELVWTGPEAETSRARDTAIVVTELFERAQTSVLVAGYSFDHGKEILAPLHRALQRGAAADLFLDVTWQVDPLPGRARADVAFTRFLQRNWPFGPPHPAFWFDPRGLQDHALASLHAKCVVVDHRWALVTSANFTDRGHDRNFEVGVLLDDNSFAEALEFQWRRAAGHGLFERWIQPERGL